MHSNPYYHIAPHDALHAHFLCATIWKAEQVSNWQHRKILGRISSGNSWRHLLRTDLPLQGTALLSK